MTTYSANRHIVYMAIELSASSWLVASQRPMSKKVKLRHLEASA